MRTGVRDHYTSLREAGDVLLTSDLVVSETATRLRFDAGLDAALAFRNLLEEAVEAGRLIVRHADAELDARAWDLIERNPGLTCRSPTASAPSPRPRAAPPRSSGWTTLPRPRLQPRAVTPACDTEYEERSMTHPDTFGARSTLLVGGIDHEVFRLGALQSRFDVAAFRTPCGSPSRTSSAARTADRYGDRHRGRRELGRDGRSLDEITFAPARVLLQDFTGVPAVVDLAAMRDAMAKLGGDPAGSTR